MRISSGKAGLAIIAGIACLLLAGCSGLSNGTASWRGGVLINERDHTREEPALPMHLTLRPDGTGRAVNLPRERQKWSTNICIQVTNDELYTGEIRWRNINNTSFDISFEGVTYTFAGKVDKFHIDWSRAYLFTCNAGPEYWYLDVSCADSGEWVTENSMRCTDADTYFRFNAP